MFDEADWETDSELDSDFEGDGISESESENDADESTREVVSAAPPPQPPVHESPTDGLAEFLEDTYPTAVLDHVPSVFAPPILSSKPLSGGVFFSVMLRKWGAQLCCFVF